MRVLAYRSSGLAAVFFAGALPALSPVSRAAQPGGVPLARVVDAFGKREKKLPGTTLYRAVSVGDRLPEQTTLRTGPDAAVLLELPDRHMVRIGARSTVVLSQLGQDKQFALKVLAGQIWTLVKKANHPAKFTVETSSGVAGVTGTLFGVALDEETQETVVSTGEGSVRVQALDAQGQPTGEAVPVTQGMMTRVARQRPAFFPHQQGQGHRQMWQQLYREGAWAQQSAPGALRLGRGTEGSLARFLRAYEGKLPLRPLPGMRPPRRKP